jgi:hypothetical protein
MMGNVGRAGGATSKGASRHGMCFVLLAECLVLDCSMSCYYSIGFVGYCNNDIQKAKRCFSIREPIHINLSKQR